jgi:hypothetical protein
MYVGGATVGVSRTGGGERTTSTGTGGISYAGAGTGSAMATGSTSASGSASATATGSASATATGSTSVDLGLGNDGSASATATGSGSTSASATATGSASATATRLDLGLSNRDGLGLDLGLGNGDRLGLDLGLSNRDRLGLDLGLGNRDGLGLSLGLSNRDGLGLGLSLGLSNGDVRPVWCDGQGLDDFDRRAFEAHTGDVVHAGCANVATATQAQPKAVVDHRRSADCRSDTPDKARQALRLYGLGQRALAAALAERVGRRRAQSQLLVDRRRRSAGRLVAEQPAVTAQPVLGAYDPSVRHHTIATVPGQGLGSGFC